MALELVGALFGGIVLISLLAAAIKITREYERGVIFRLGRFLGVKGPGLFLIIPIIDAMVRIDLRTRVIDVPRQRIITKDNVTVEVDAVVYYRVAYPDKAILAVENYVDATALFAQTTLRDVIGQVELDYLLSKRDEINKRLQDIIDEATNPWGIKVTAVTIRDVILPEEMLRAIAKQAEAERERRARVIVATGELEASKKMTEAASLYQKVPMAMKLRELQTITEVAREKNLIVVPTGGFGTIAGLTKAFLTSEERKKEEKRKEAEEKVREVARRKETKVKEGEEIPEIPW